MELNYSSTIQNLQDHLIVLENEVAQIEKDLQLHRTMAKKYGGKEFEKGEERLKHLRDDKNLSIQRIHKQLKKFQSSIHQGQSIINSIEKPKVKVSVFREPNHPPNPSKQTVRVVRKNPPTVVLYDEETQRSLITNSPILSFKSKNV